MYPSFKDNIWGPDQADIQLISKFNKEFWFLLSVIDIHNKYVWVVPLKYKKGKEIYSTHNEGKSVVAEKFVRTL